jgi:hypothetical protein
MADHGCDASIRRGAQVDKSNPVNAAANRVVELETELEAAGTASTHGDALVEARAILHDWVNTVTGVVTSPGVGRVTLIHVNGTETKIASPELPYLLSRPVNW